MPDRLLRPDSKYELQNIDKQQSHFFPDVTVIGDVRDREKLTEMELEKWYRMHPDWNINILRPMVIFGERNWGNVYNLLKQIFLIGWVCLEDMGLICWLS